MKIAVTTQEGQVFQHFGKCPTFTLFEVNDKVITGKTVLDAVGSGHGALAGFLKAAGADMVICGGIGGGAKEALDNIGIGLCAGVSGGVEDAVKGYLDGTIRHNPSPTCNHHHGEGHHCHH